MTDNKLEQTNFEKNEKKQTPTQVSACEKLLSDGHAHLYSEYEPCLPTFAYRNPQKNKMGGNVVYVNVATSVFVPILLQLCRDPDEENIPEECREMALKAPFGLQEPRLPQQSDPNRKTLDVSIENPRLLKFLQDWDKRNLEVAYENSKKWFSGKAITKEMLEYLYKPMVREPKPPKDKPNEKKDFKPTLRLKVTTGGDMKKRTKIFIKVGIDEVTKVPILKQGTFSDLTPKVRVVPIVACTGLWFMDASFGMGFQATDLLIIPKKEKPQMDFVCTGGLRPILLAEEAGVTCEKGQETSKDLKDKKKDKENFDYMENATAALNLNNSTNAALDTI